MIFLKRRRKWINSNKYNKCSNNNTIEIYNQFREIDREIYIVTKSGFYTFKKTKPLDQLREV